MRPAIRAAFVEHRFPYGDARNSEVETVAAYLPSNFHAFDYLRDADGLAGVLVVGFDYSGWTLDGYVIPRLASGLIAAQEVTP